MLIAEDMVLLAYDDETGRPEGTLSDPNLRLSGAVLAELALTERVALTPGRRPRVEVLDASATGSPVLDEALATIATRQRTPAELVTRLSPGMLDRVLNALAERGVLRRERGKVLGLFPTTRWPARDSSHELLLRAHLEAVLIGGQDPDPRTATLITLLKDTSVLSRLVPQDQRKQARARAREVATQDWAASAAATAIQDAIATIAATTVVITASQTSSS